MGKNYKNLSFHQSLQIYIYLQFGDQLNFVSLLNTNTHKAYFKRFYRQQRIYNSEKSFWLLKR